MRRKDSIFLKFQAISQYKKTVGKFLEYYDLQERVSRSRRNVWGKNAFTEVLLSVSPEKAAGDFLNSSVIYLQPMLMATRPALVQEGVEAPSVVRLGAPRLICNVHDLESVLENLEQPEESSSAA